MATTAVGKNITLEEVLQHVQELENRVAALERITAPEIPQAAAPVAVAQQSLPTVSLSGGLFATIARALLGFAGAYVLRAIAESGAVPHAAGIVAGVLYAIAWLLWSVHVPADEAAASALYGLTSALIFSGLLWENCVEMRALPATLAASLIAFFACCGFAVAWRSSRPRTAGIVAMIIGTLALSLSIATHAVIPFTAALLVIAAATELAACEGAWLQLRVFPALAADLAVLIVTWVVTRPQGIPESYPSFGMSSVIALQMSLLLIYVCGMGYRTLVKGHDTTRFEIAQNVTAISLFIWGSVLTGREAPAARLAVEAFCLLAGAACYAIVVKFLAHQSRPRNFLMYGLFGLALVMSGISILFSGFTLVMVWCTLAVIASWLGTHQHRVSLQLHAPAYLAAAATTCGLLEFSLRALHGATTPETSRIVEIAIVTAALTLCYLMAGIGDNRKSRIPAGLIAAMLCWVLLGLGGAGISGLLGPQSTISSTLRTGLICGLALVLARAGDRRSELRWLLYPLMFYGAYRLLVEDFPHGRPTALALSLLFYGGTLLMLTRMVRGERPAPPASHLVS